MSLTLKKKNIYIYIKPHSMCDAWNKIRFYPFFIAWPPRLGKLKFQPLKIKVCKFTHHTVVVKSFHTLIRAMHVIVI